MNPSSIEDLLADLGQKWPVPSVAEAVIARIEAESISLSARSTARGWRVGLWASAAAVMVAISIACAAIVSAPRTLQAQVERALARTAAAFITVSGLDAQGVRRNSNIWYSSEHGFRVESPEETIVDNGQQQWTWQPNAVPDEMVVVRRQSADGRKMLSEMFALNDAPADWKQHRAAEHDCEIGGEKCSAYLIVPPPRQELFRDGQRLVPVADASPPRIIVWSDRQDRIVQIEQQRQVQGEWQSGRQTSIHYDADVPAEKFRADFPARAKVVDADATLEDRFPLSDALATEESEGLLFAIHEAERMEGGMVFIVSSVRGTRAYLRAHPPTRRRLNLTTTLLDVAYVSDAAGTIDGDWNRASLAYAQNQGVYYSWWIAVPRRTYFVKDGVEVEVDHRRKPETADKTRISLFANPMAMRTPKGALKSVSATIELALADKATTLPEIAAHALGDASLLTTRGSWVGLRGGISQDTMRHMAPSEVNATQFVAEIRSQLAWLHGLDLLPEGAGAPMH
jgi:hypothetical protein